MSGLLRASIILQKAPKYQAPVIVSKNEPRAVNWREGMTGKNYEYFRNRKLYEIRSRDLERKSMPARWSLNFFKYLSHFTTFVIISIMCYSVVKMTQSGGIHEYKKARMIPDNAKKPIIEV